MYFQINLWADFLLPLHTSHIAELGTPVLEYASPIDLYSAIKFPCLSNCKTAVLVPKSQVIFCPLSLLLTVGFLIPFCLLPINFLEYSVC